MKAWLHSVRVLVWKDLLQEWRSRDILTSMLAFAVLSLFIFNYALELSPINRSEIAPGIVWVVMVFAGTLGLNRSFTAEQDQGCFERLIMAVPDLSDLFREAAHQPFDDGLFGCARHPDLFHSL